MIDQIMLFGDSLTQGGWQPEGFAQRLAYAYARRLDVINRGLSGYNTKWALPVFEKVFPRKGSTTRVKLLTIWFGANDSVLEHSPQHLSLDDFTGNLKRLISMVQEPSSEWYSPDTNIILITPPPINETARAEDLASRDPPLALDRSVDTTKRYVDAVITLGKELQLPVVNIYTPIWQATMDGNQEKLKEYLGDGLHLTTAGYTILYDRLIDTIKASYPDIYYEAIPFVFAPWAELI